MNGCGACTQKRWLYGQADGLRRQYSATPSTAAAPPDTRVRALTAGSPRSEHSRGVTAPGVATRRGFLGTGGHVGQPREAEQGVALDELGRGAKLLILVPGRLAPSGEPWFTSSLPCPIGRPNAPRPARPKRARRSSPPRSTRSHGPATPRRA